MSGTLNPSGLGVETLRQRVSSSPRARAAFIARSTSLVIPLVLLFAALLIQFAYDPLNRPLTGDPGIFAYISRLAADGLAPHQAVFNEQSSLTYLLGGAAMALGRVVQLPDLLAFRLLSMAVAALVVMLTYPVGRALAHERLVGLGAALIMLGYQGFLRRAAIALEPKSLMVLFGLATLLLLSKRQWGWAGLTAAAAGLALQPGWGYLLVVLLLAAVQGGRGAARLKALAASLLGAGAVLALYAGYYAVHGALGDMLRQTFIAPLIMHPVTRRSLVQRVLDPVLDYRRGYPNQIIFGVMALGGWLSGLVWLLPAPRRAVYYLFQNRRTAGTLLAAHGYALYLMVDFQNFPDWLPLMPFIAILAAAFLFASWNRLVRIARRSSRVRTIGFAASMAALLAASWFILFTTNPSVFGRSTLTWQAQARTAQELERRLPADQPIFVIGNAELLFFMGRQNMTPYIYFIGFVDAAVDAFDPGGFDALLARVRAARPALMNLTRLKIKRFSKPARLQDVRALTAPDYAALKACNTLPGVQLYLRRDLAARAFPATEPRGCFSVAKE